MEAILEIARAAGWAQYVELREKFVPRILAWKQAVADGVAGAGGAERSGSAARWLGCAPAYPFETMLPARQGFVDLGIWFEERDLIAQFGDRYRAYRKQTGMLLPRLGLKPAHPASDEQQAVADNPQPR